MDSNDLYRFIKEHAIQAEIVRLEADTPTVAAAAGALGVHPDQIIKSLLFFANDSPVLVIANGLARLNRKRLAEHLGTSRRRVKIASPEQVFETAGYPAGAVPPFGHAQRLRTILDWGVTEQSEIYGGGGEINALMRLSVEELRRVVGQEVATLVDTPS